MPKLFQIAAAAALAFVAPAAAQNSAPAQPAPAQSEWFPADQQAAPVTETPVTTEAGAQPPANAAAPQGQTIPRRDIFDAAENVFGRGAEDLARLLERILGEQGEPIAYISGEEASGAFVLGVRYGSGVMRHQIEGDRNVYWTGPSIGFDAGAQASKVFVLVYNLHDGQRLFRRYPAAEG
ncbi:MAG TPA: EipA family protein, partial [Allosphingosinicella sp.]|nr:EipA family protein [Allosphingosinicella sp.]